jgi:NADH-quinone oxidoreductase subunit N
MYFDAPQDTSPIMGDVSKRTLLALNGVAVLVLGVVPGPLMTVCLQAMQHTLPL